MRKVKKESFNWTRKKLDRFPDNLYWFDFRKGYGFISLEGDEEETDIFVHFSNILQDGFKKLDQGDYVQFELKEDSKSEKGPEALKVKVITKDRRY
ncbi:MAG: cold-shock protein [Promethearchaeota archaeon]